MPALLNNGLIFVFELWLVNGVSAITVIIVLNPIVHLFYCFGYSVCKRDRMWLSRVPILCNRQFRIGGIQIRGLISRSPSELALRLGYWGHSLTKGHGGGRSCLHWCAGMMVNLTSAAGLMV